MLPGRCAGQRCRWAATSPNALSPTLQQRPRKPFRYNDRGSLATIGRAAAVAQFPRFKLTGYPAWLAWLFIHILFLIGFRNRIWS